MRSMFKATLMLVLLLAAVALSAQPRPPSNLPGTIVWEVDAERGLRGHVLSAAVEDESHVFLATGSHLFLVRDGKAEVVSAPPVDDASLVLAPGGRLYGYLIPRKNAGTLFDAQIRFTDSARVIELQVRDEENGFLALWLGYRGSLIVTVTPLGDWQALRGPFRYTFWSADGQVLGEFDRADRAIPAFDPSGGAILLLEPRMAVAFSAKGERFWEVEGTFRKAAIAASGSVALLNPKRAIRDIIVVGANRQRVRVALETPVHHLALSPDGVTAFAAGDRGTFAFFNPRRPRVRAPRRVPLAENPYVFDVQFLTADTVTLGILHRADVKRGVWLRGSYAAINQKGALLFARTFEVEQPATDQIDVAPLYGSQFFVGFNDTRALLARVGP
ncbi:MAG: hypothetical protein ACYC7A_11310 [Thermoanaerobaculia bacterium]